MGSRGASPQRRNGCRRSYDASVVPSLVTQCIDTLVEDRIRSVPSLQGMEEHLCICLLKTMISRGKLDFAAAQKFIGCGHEEISIAVSGTIYHLIPDTSSTPAGCRM